MKTPPASDPGGDDCNKRRLYLPLTWDSFGGPDDFDWRASELPGDQSAEAIDSSPFCKYSEVL
jgi:hypothetical protein